MNHSVLMREGSRCFPGMVICVGRFSYSTLSRSPGFAPDHIYQMAFQQQAHP